MISLPRVIAAVPAAAALDPALVTDMVARAIAFVEQQTHRRFGLVEAASFVLEGTGTTFLRLPEPVVVPDSDEALVVTERQYAGESGATVTAFDVRSGGNTDYLVRHGGTPWTNGWEYQVDYQRGYEVDHLPADIEQLVLYLVSIRVGRLGREGILSETIGGYSYSIGATYAFEDGDLRAIPGAMRTIERWRRPVYAL